MINIRFLLKLLRLIIATFTPKVDEILDNLVLKLTTKWIILSKVLSYSRAKRVKIIWAKFCNQVKNK